MKSLSESLRKNLEAQIKKFNLESVSDEIIKNSTECLAILPLKEDDYSKIGNSRFGGDPDLPKNIPWPLAPNKGNTGKRYGNFIAQINFAEFASFTKDYNLPDQGLLYIFVFYMECAGDAVKTGTIFYDGDFSDLKRREPPVKSLSTEDALKQLDSGDISWLLEDKDKMEDAMCVEFLNNLKPFRIYLKPTISIATNRETFRDYIRMNTIEVNELDGQQRLLELEDAIKFENQIGQFFGFANSSDNSNLYRNVALEQLGKRHSVVSYWNSKEEYELAIKEQEELKSNSVEYYKNIYEGVMLYLEIKNEVLKLENEWQLFFRLDSNRYMNLLIFDNDPLYIFIRKEDLALKNFSHLSGEVTQG